MKFTCHSKKQEDGIFSTKKITAALTGIQYGKTTIGAVWMRRQVHEHTSKSDNFLVCAPTYKILQQSTLPSFLSFMSGIGKFQKSDSIYKINGGGTVYIRSLSDADSIVGITDVRAAWADECGKLSLYAWENLQARASFKDAPIMLTSSPYSLNWVYKDIVRPVKKGQRLDEINLIQARSDENPYFPKSEYDQRKKTMDPRRFKMLYGGEWEQPEGIVYDCYDEELNTCDPFQLPSSTEYFGGIDWGYRDPFVLLIRGFSPYGDVFEVSEFYKTGLKPSEIVDVINQKWRVWGVKRFYCDPSRPDMIAELNSHKIPAVKADNDIQKGIDSYYELIKSRKYKIFRGKCPFLNDELDCYHYPEEVDLKPDQSKAKNFELPVDTNNHCLDAARYLTLGTHRSTIKHTPKVPEAKREYDHPTDRFHEKIRRQAKFNDE